MNTKAIIALFLLLISPLSIGWACAGENPAEGSDKLFADMASEKMAAAIKLDAKVSATKGQSFGGVFISKDGLALISLESLVWQEKPTAVTADGTPLKLGRLLGLFPTDGLALMIFDHHPKVWMEFAVKEPEVGDTAAVVVTDSTAKCILDGKVPPVTGKILAKRSCARGDYRKQEFTGILSLGAGLNPQQRLHMAGSPFVIDGDGHLVAFFYSQTMGEGQVLIELTPVVALAESIRAMVKDDESMAVPLTEANNPYDPVRKDPAFNRMAVSRRMGDREESRNALKDLLARYPGSFYLKDTALDTAGFYDPDDPLLGLEDFPVCDPGAPLPLQVKTLDCRAFLFVELGLAEKAIEARKSAIVLSPKDEPVCRHFLARIYANMERFEDAERLMREAYPFFGDYIAFVGDYERILTKLGKFKEADEMGERVWELTEIYRRR